VFLGLFSRLGRRLIAILLGLGIALGFSVFPIALKAAEFTPIPSVSSGSRDVSSSAKNLLEQGMQAYYEGQLVSAIALWQEAIKQYQHESNQLGAAQAWTNLAMAYTLQGKGSEAKAAIANSLDLVPLPTVDSERLIRAEALNVQGILLLSWGQAQNALASWQQSSLLFQQARSREGVFRSAVNQAKALQMLGLYPRACQKLLDILELGEEKCSQLAITQLEAQLKPMVSLSPNHQAAWITLAIALRQVGNLEDSEAILQLILKKSPSPTQEGEIRFNLGKLFDIANEPLLALEQYQQALQFPLRPNQQMEVKLAELDLWSQQGRWSEVALNFPLIWSRLQQSPPIRGAIFARLNGIKQLMSIAQQAPVGLSLPKDEEVRALLEQTWQQTQSIGDRWGENYTLGLIGEFYFKRREWDLSRNFTEKALGIAENLRASELIYQWQWQLARIDVAQGHYKNAIALYQSAIETLKPISGDLAANPEIQFSFQRKVEPLYRELLSLILPKTDQDVVDQANLTTAKDSIESLQLVELNNFFREICLTRKPASIETLDKQAAILYPIILSDRLVIILSLPGQPLQAKISPVPKSELESTVNEFRYNLLLNDRQKHLDPAKKLYDWLLRPIEAELKQFSAIKTLVFVMDGALRNVPAAALYDRQKQTYLIESYQVALTPGLTLLAPQPIQQTSLNSLLAGLSQARLGFAPLKYVESEFKKIESLIPAQILLNQNFTKLNLRKELNSSVFPIIHFATHGQFSSRYNETFILAWDNKLKINDLESLLKDKEVEQGNAIELLVLSACETAVGDQRAVLGLAGIAVRLGAKSTLATLWSINDRSTSVLMDQFYSQLAQKKVTKAEALRQAQLALLKNPQYQHPYFWAPYILVGNWL